MSDDYMSDAFIDNCDVRPGLIASHSKKRIHNLSKKKEYSDQIHKQHNKSRKLDEKEKREEGLNNAISSSNKGFSMLQKMGFTPGSSLGKGGGITEPVPIVIKTDRYGLGRTEAIKQLKLQKLKYLAKRKVTKITIEDYRLQMSKKSKQKEIEIDLRKSQKVCQNLDLQNGIMEPEEKWFWLNYEEDEVSNTNTVTEDEVQLSSASPESLYFTPTSLNSKETELEAKEGRQEANDDPTVQESSPLMSEDVENLQHSPLQRPIDRSRLSPTPSEFEFRSISIASKYTAPTTSKIKSSFSYCPTYVPTPTTSATPLTTPEYCPTQPKYVPTAPSYCPTSPKYVLAAPEYKPSPKYIPTTSATPSITPEYCPTIPEYVPNVPSYCPTSKYVPTAPAYKPSPKYVPTPTSSATPSNTSEYCPTSPEYVPTAPKHMPSPEYVPTSKSKCEKPTATDSSNNEEEEFDSQEKLELLTMYLRHIYCYCLWCGVQYDGKEDLQACPGLTREDH